jgi:D-xylonolactonase
MNYTIELITDTACRLGEGPIWHSDEQCLYWVDILAGHIWRYDPHSEACQRVFSGDVIGGMTLQQDGSLLLFMAAGRVALLRDGLLTTVVPKSAEHAAHRFNDVIATPAGNVFCGTLANGGGGALYCLARDRTLEERISAVGVSNGMGFAPDLTTFYYTDSEPARTITRFRYHAPTDTFTDGTIFANFPVGGGVPDGLTVDAAGYIWSAVWNGGRVVRFTPTGAIDCEITIPDAKRATSVAFGGADYADLYVTTAGGDDKATHGANAGALFRIRCDGVHGKPEFRSQIALD